MPLVAPTFAQHALSQLQRHRLAGLAGVVHQVNDFAVRLHQHELEAADGLAAAGGGLDPACPR
jgi:hypothetical protein